MPLVEGGPSDTRRGFKEDQSVKSSGEGCARSEPDGRGIMGFSGVSATYYRQLQYRPPIRSNAGCP